MSVVAVVATHRQHLLLLDGLVARQLGGVVEADFAAVSFTRTSHGESFGQASVMSVDKSS